MYTRIELCALSGVDLDNFKSLQRRGQLPISTDIGIRVRRVEGYSAIDVLRLAVGQAFINQAGYERGLNASTGMAIASAVNDWIITAFSDSAGPDIWAGIIGARISRFENGKVKAGWYVGGQLSAVTAEIARDSSRAGRGVTRVFLVNISEVLREVHDRARQARIFFPISLEEATAA